jgi:hypothetical protein
MNDPGPGGIGSTEHLAPENKDGATVSGYNLEKMAKFEVHINLKGYLVKHCHHDLFSGSLNCHALSFWLCSLTVYCKLENAIDSVILIHDFGELEVVDMKVGRMFRI